MEADLPAPMAFLLQKTIGKLQFCDWFFRSPSINSGYF
jgi:hypothetical protein